MITLAFFLMIMYASTAVSSNLLNISEFYKWEKNFIKDYQTINYREVIPAVKYMVAWTYPLSHDVLKVWSEDKRSFLSVVDTLHNAAIINRFNSSTRYVFFLTMKYFVLPRKWPKSMWNRLPDLVTMTLSLWRSPIPCDQNEIIIWLSYDCYMTYYCKHAVPECRWQRSIQHRTAWISQQLLQIDYRNGTTNFF